MTDICTLQVLSSLLFYMWLALDENFSKWSFRIVGICPSSSIWTLQTIGAAYYLSVLPHSAATQSTSAQTSFVDLILKIFSSLDVMLSGKLLRTCKSAARFVSSIVIVSPSRSAFGSLLTFFALFCHSARISHSPHSSCMKAFFRCPSPSRLRFPLFLSAYFARFFYKMVWYAHWFACVIWCLMLISFQVFIHLPPCGQVECISQRTDQSHGSVQKSFPRSFWTFWPFFPVFPELLWRMLTSPSFWSNQQDTDCSEYAVSSYILSYLVLYSNQLTPSQMLTRTCTFSNIIWLNLFWKDGTSFLGKGWIHRTLEKFLHL